MPAQKDPTQWQASNVIGGTPGSLDDNVTNPPIDVVDQDQDGLPAYAEAALGTSDTEASSGRDLLTITQATRTVDGTPVLCQRVRVGKSATAAVEQFQLETSTDLRTWSTAEGFSRTNSDNNDAAEWQSDQPISEALFVRVKILAP